VPAARQRAHHGAAEIAGAAGYEDPHSCWLLVAGC
jgi:hypothetical protein